MKIFIVFVKQKRGPKRPRTETGENLAWEMFVVSRERYARLQNSAVTGTKNITRQNRDVTHFINDEPRSGLITKTVVDCDANTALSRWCSS